MASTRIVVGLVVTAASAVVALAACSSTSVGTGTADGGSSSGTSGSGGLKNCPSPGSTCTQAESDAYGQCFVDKCDADLAACYGADYKNGNFSGVCGPYLTCRQACACGDTTCQANCPTPTPACSTCIQGFASSCTAKCPAPACLTGGSSGSSGTSGSSGKTCTGLAGCCARMTDATIKSSCQSTYDQIAGDATSCNAAYQSYASYCP